MYEMIKNVGKERKKERIIVLFALFFIPLEPRFYPIGKGAAVISI